MAKTNANSLAELQAINEEILKLSGDLRKLQDRRKALVSDVQEIMRGLGVVRRGRPAGTKPKRAATAPVETEAVAG